MNPAEFPHAMAMVPLTLTIGLCLAFSLLVFFLHAHARQRLETMSRQAARVAGQATPPAGNDSGAR